jgi:plastocyanin
MKMRLALVLGLGFYTSVQACSIDGGCDCPIPHAAMASEPAFVMAAPPPPPVPFSTFAVYVFDFDYSINQPPGAIADVVVNAGDSVQWQWIGNFAHSVKSVAGSSEVFASAVGSAVAPFSHSFNTPGVYQYYCTVHGFDNGNGTAGGMAGKVTVLAVPEPASAAGLTAGAMLLLRRKK